MPTFFPVVFPYIAIRQFILVCFQEVAMYLGSDKRYVEVPFSKIHWPAGRLTPPPDEPECGFDDAKCVPSKAQFVIHERDNPR